MKFFKCLALLACALTTLSVYGQQETGFERKTESRDDTGIRELVESKENVNIEKKSNNLEISGDVRFVWQNKFESGELLFFERDSGSYTDSDIHRKYGHLRGGNHVGRDNIPISHNDFNVKFNLKFKYDFDQTWAMGHLQFNNLAGIATINDCVGRYPVYNESGTDIVKTIELNRSFNGKGSGFGSAFNLKRAYIGHTLYADGKSRLDLEIGRRQLDDVFMSEVQFNNYCDGVLFEFASEIDQVSDWYLSAGTFIVDQRVNHFGLVAEIGFLNIFDSKFDVRYSYIDWQKIGNNRCKIYNPIGGKFNISQFTLAYQITPKIFCYDVPMELYGAFLINTAAKKTAFTNHKKANLAWYFDIYAGNVLKKGDWSFEFIYSVVQAQAVPDFDVCGVGRGNIMGSQLYDYTVFDLASNEYRTIDSYNSSSSSSSSNIYGYIPQQGNANYQGFMFDFLYAVTDNFSIDFAYEFSKAADKKIGGRHSYQNAEIEFLYAF